MSSYDPGKGVLLNLRVIDQDAAADLTNHLQALLDRSASSVGSLAELLDQAQRVLGDGTQIAKRLEEHLGNGAALKELLETQLTQSESFLNTMDARRHELDAASARLSGEVAESTQRLQGLAEHVESRVESLSNESTQRLHELAQHTETRVESLASESTQRLHGLAQHVEARVEALANESSERIRRDFMPAFERAQAIAELISKAEAAIAVNALHAALDGGVKAVPATVEMAAPASAPALEQSGAINELRSRVDDLTLKCNEQERTHQISSESQAALLSGVSQELHREIAQLMVSAEALRATVLDRQQIDHLNDASASAAALLEMIRGIPDLSFEQPQQPVRMDGEFDLRLEIQSMSGLLAKRARDGGRTLTCQIENDVPSMVRGDCGRLRQTLLYMLNGAFKLAGPGEIVMRTHVEHTVDTYTSVRVTISHQGRGIPSEQINRLFHAVPPAPEAGGATGSAEPSSSLGLAVAEQLVQRMGGSVGVEADDPSRFALWFRVPWPKPLSSADNRRVFNRLMLESVLCNLGEVIDLSLGGARVRCAKEHTGTVDLEITDDERKITISTEVMWCNHLGWRKYEVGLRFLNVTPDIAEQLTRLTMQNRVRRVLGTQP